MKYAVGTNRLIVVLVARWNHCII